MTTAKAKRNELKSGKRYWFWSGYRIRSGLYSGETDPHNGNVIIYEKSGVRWSVPADELYEREEDVRKNG